MAPSGKTPSGKAWSHRARKRLAIAVLVLALPAYIVVAISVVGLFGRPPVLVELAIYAVLGVIWVLPLKRVFQGVGLPDPEQSEEGDDARD